MRMDIAMHMLQEAQANCHYHQPLSFMLHDPQQPQTMSMCRDPTGMCEIETDDGQHFADDNGNSRISMKYNTNEPQTHVRVSITWSTRLGPRDGWSSPSSSSSSSERTTSPARSRSGSYIRRRVMCKGQSQVQRPKPRQSVRRPSATAKAKAKPKSYAAAKDKPKAR